MSFLSPGQTAQLKAYPVKSQADVLNKMKLFEMMCDLREAQAGQQKAEQTEENSVENGALPSGAINNPPSRTVAEQSQEMRMDQTFTDVEEKEEKKVLRVKPDGTVEFESSRTARVSKQEARSLTLAEHHRLVTEKVDHEMTGYQKKLNGFAEQLPLIRLALQAWAQPYMARMERQPAFAHFVRNPASRVGARFKNPLTFGEVLACRLWLAATQPSTCAHLRPRLAVVKHYRRIQLSNKRFLKVFVCDFESKDGSTDEAEIPEVLLRHFPSYLPSLQAFFDFIVKPYKVRRLDQEARSVSKALDSDEDWSDSDPEEDDPEHLIDSACIFPPQ